MATKRPTITPDLETVFDRAIDWREHEIHSEYPWMTSQQVRLILRTELRRACHAAAVRLMCLEEIEESWLREP